MQTWAWMMPRRSAYSYRHLAWSSSRFPVGAFSSVARVVFIGGACGTRCSFAHNPSSLVLVVMATRLRVCLRPYAGVGARVGVRLVYKGDAVSGVQAAVSGCKQRAATPVLCATE